MCEGFTIYGLMIILRTSINVSCMLWPLANMKTIAVRIRVSCLIVSVIYLRARGEGPVMECFKVTGTASLVYSMYKILIYLLLSQIYITSVCSVFARLIKYLIKT